MNQKSIKRIFDKVFNNMPNPVFCYPVSYFQHGNFLCEIARTKQMSQMEWNNLPYQNKNPLLIFEALFVDDGLFVTTLERKDRDTYIHRMDLCKHIDNKNQINSFINSLK